ncbi:MAG: thiol peroxidase [Cellvibrionaceae bacterium]|jgi:thiol peroxidase
MTNERHGAVTIQGNALTVLGNPVSVGDTAPDATLTSNDMKPVKISDSNGKIRLISVVPSLATGICDLQTKRMNEEAAGLGDDVVILTVSAEHPFNQKAWCGAAGVDAVQVLSDHQNMAFGEAYGLWIKEWRLEQRAMFVLDRDGKVTYTEYVPEVAQHPDYDAALAAVKAAA